MFGQASNLDSMQIARGVIVALVAVMLVPAALMMVAALAMLMSPVAFVAIPFMLPVFFGTASAEHAAVVRRSSMRPPATLPVMASS